MTTKTLQLIKVWN